MNPGVHQNEDTLLDFAYGELPAHEAAAVDAHVRTCAKCSQALAQIRGVRSMFAPLPMEAAPEAGLESLLAYAEQHARRTKAPAQAGWRRWLFVFSSAAALLVVGVVATRAMEEAPQTPADVFARNQKEAERGLGSAQLPGLAQDAEKAANAPTPVAAAAEAPQAPAPVMAAPSRPAATADVDEGGLEGKRGGGETRNKDTGSQNQKAPPPAPKLAKPSGPSLGDSLRDEPRQSESKRGLNSTWNEDSNSVGGLKQDFSNAAGARRQESADKKVEAQAAREPTKERSRERLDDLSDGTSARQSATGGTATPPSSFGLGTGSSAPSPPPQVEPVAAAPRPVSPPVQQAPAPPPADAPAPLKKMTSGYGLPSSAPRSAPSSVEADDAETVASAPAGRAEQRPVRDVESVKQALTKARELGSVGDRKGEVEAALLALSAGATGYERAEALKRACDGYEALRLFDRAESFCGLLVSEFPATAAGQEVARRRAAVRKAAEEKAKARPAEAPASVSPAY
ncbi:MAG: zf-HC2 domain-containing protein [Myxococcaceae bacterium]|nr:zf-HC2 domain-containing protein [Myxococcaceae bacterium]